MTDTLKRLNPNTVHDIIHGKGSNMKWLCKCGKHGEGIKSMQVHQDFIKNECIQYKRVLNLVDAVEQA